MKNARLPSNAGVTLLNCRRLPGRLDSEQAAILLGFHEHDIGPLVSGGLIKPLGNPASNSPKYFASVVIEGLAADERWLDRATRALGKYWSDKNSRKSLKTPLPA